MSKAFHTTWAGAVWPGKIFSLLHLHQCNSQRSQNFSRWEMLGLWRQNETHFTQ